MKSLFLFFQTAFDVLCIIYGQKKYFVNVFFEFLCVFKILFESLCVILVFYDIFVVKFHCSYKVKGQA